MTPPPSTVLELRAIRSPCTEPRGKRIGATFLLPSLVSTGTYAYFGVLLDGPHLLGAMAVAFALSGIAESLPPRRRHVAGGLRIAAIGVLVAVLASLLVVPDVVMDG